MIGVGGRGLFEGRENDTAGVGYFYIDISDEFNDTEVDRGKWFIEGENGGDYYIWKGRPPSQFAEHNVVQDDGMLKIREDSGPDSVAWMGSAKFSNEQA